MMKLKNQVVASLALAGVTLLPTADVRADFGGDASFYEVKLGVCGKSSDNTQLVAAVSHVVFDSAPSASPISNKFCGKKAKVTNGKKSVIVTIIDRCASCAKDDIALSPAAFKKIASMDSGKVPVQWKFL